MAEAALDAGAKLSSTRWFYMGMALLCLTIGVLGFMPTYFVPMAQGRLQVEPMVHIHGLILFSWLAFLCVQTRLAATGQILAHRTWGVLGVAIVTAMVFMVVAIVSLRIRQAALPGQPPSLSHRLRAFEWLSIGGLVFFTPVFVLAMINVARPEIHKRLMLLGTISMLQAPIARWFVTFLAPHHAARPAANALPEIAAPPVVFTIPPGLVADLILVVAMAYDWRTRGRPHPVYLIGGAPAVLPTERAPGGQYAGLAGRRHRHWPSGGIAPTAPAVPSGRPGPGAPWRPGRRGG